MRPLLLALTLTTLGVGLAYNQTAPILPDPRLSPGAALTSDPKIICVSGYTKTVRNVPQSLKEQVYRSSVPEILQFRQKPSGTRFWPHDRV